MSIFDEGSWLTPEQESEYARRHPQLCGWMVDDVVLHASENWDRKVRTAPVAGEAWQAWLDSDRQDSFDTNAIMPDGFIERYNAGMATEIQSYEECHGESDIERARRAA